MVLEMLLSLDGYEVHSVEDGRQALEYLQHNTPQMAILDVNMPHMSGIDVCDRMNRVQRLKHVPVIILTVLRDDRTAHAARAAGADLIVLKPLEGKDFRKTVRDLLAGKAVDAV